MKSSWFILLCLALVANLAQAQTSDSVTSAIDSFRPCYRTAISAALFDSLLSAHNGDCHYRLVQNGQQKIYWFYNCHDSSQVSAGLSPSTNNEVEILAAVVNTISGNYNVFSTEADNKFLNAWSLKMLYWELQVKSKR